jgi:predicted ATPase
MSELILKNFSLLKNFRTMKPFSIDFKELTVIVGENGSGKSSFFEILTNSSHHEEYTKIDFKKGGTFKFFDTEKNNPRKKSYIENSYDATCRFVSHGEAMLPILLENRNFSNELILIDEPEAGISLKNQKKIFEAFTVAIRNGCQIIISTHSYFFIKSVDEVFNLDKKKWQKSSRFLTECGL